MTTTFTLDLEDHHRPPNPVPRYPEITYKILDFLSDRGVTGTFFVLGDLSERHPDAVFGKIDTEAQPELAATFKIASIPTLMIVRDNVVLYSQPGALPEAALEQLITKAGELDMDEVRASITGPAANAPPASAPAAR